VAAHPSFDNTGPKTERNCGSGTIRHFIQQVSIALLNFVA
jgi:hypothetical protein